MEINNPGLSEWKHFAILSSFNSETFLTNTLGGGRVGGLYKVGRMQNKSGFRKVENLQVDKSEIPDEESIMIVIVPS